jgi:LysM repeat protein
VAEGETLSEIAARYGTTIEAITELNGLSDPDNIPAGMVLRLP